MTINRIVIDFHTHIFPDALAERAVKQLAESGDGSVSYSDGTARGLWESMQQAGITKSVTLPVSTKPAQTPTINSFCIELRDPGLIQFGTLHPDYPDLDAEIQRLVEAGIRGVKFHPDYQSFYVDEERLFPLYQRMADAGLIALFHAGEDIAFKPPFRAPPERLARVLERVPDLVIVAAHFGGYRMWDDVERHLLGRPLYLDTSFTLPYLPAEDFVRMARIHGVDRILFGTDSPWADQADELKCLLATGLTDTELDAVCHQNADRLLHARGDHWGKPRGYSSF